MAEYSDLKLNSIAIGSLPHKNINEAMRIVERDFPNIPFFPQFPKLNKNEGFITQILEGMPSFLPYKANDFYLDTESLDFSNSTDDFLKDYQEIINGKDINKLEKYGISPKFSIAFPAFEQLIYKSKPKYAKGQLAGAFTLSLTLTDPKETPVFYNKTLREVITKFVILKALWIIRRIKHANTSTTPIIFFDEPSLPAAKDLDNNKEITAMLKLISELVHINGAISAVHCCGDCDWTLVTNSKFNIISLDAWNFGKNFSNYSKDIERFLINGGKIAWGVVPTFSARLLEQISLDDLVKTFVNCVNYLTKMGIDEKLIIDNSLITSSCGAGVLSEEKAKLAMDLVFELSKELKKRFKI